MLGKLWHTQSCRACLPLESLEDEKLQGSVMHPVGQPELPPWCLPGMQSVRCKPDAHMPHAPECTVSTTI